MVSNVPRVLLDLTVLTISFVWCIVNHNRGCFIVGGVRSVQLSEKSRKVKRKVKDCELLYAYKYLQIYKEKPIYMYLLRHL